MFTFIFTQPARLELIEAQDWYENEAVGLRRFPYSLFFVVQGDSLLVIACFHASREPSRRQRRT